MARVLITGFEPFGGATANSSALAAEILAAERPGGAETVSLILPVVRYRCIDLTVAAIERRPPDLVVMLGQGGGRAAITPERVAINLDDFRQPDNAGHHPIEEPIVPGGPAAYFATLPVRAMVREMQAAGVPAAVSNSAGTYVCNHLSYGVLHHLALRRLPVRAGLIHLPYLPEQVTGMGAETPSMALETMLRGLRAAITCALATGAAVGA
ncbi:MAG: pyroglutamyl-peptidase I [Chloroflexota bacterium]